MATVGCPNCQTKYNVADEKLAEWNARMDLHRHRAAEFRGWIGALEVDRVRRAARKDAEFPADELGLDAYRRFVWIGRERHDRRIPEQNPAGLSE